MRGFCWPSLVAGLALAGPVASGDLTLIQRSLSKEPTYESKSPQYCLLVFGPEAHTRVWLVLDGDALYLDRNGNGDLTDPGERLVAREVYRRPEDRPDVEVMRLFQLDGWQADAAPILTCGPQVLWFYVHQFIPREDYPDPELVRYWLASPFDVALTTKSGHGQRAHLRFAASAQAAPILPFDGPRQFALSPKLGPHLFRRGESSELAVELHAPGWNATVRTEIYELPEAVHPVAEIEFPPGQPNGEPLRVRVELKERC